MATCRSLCVYCGASQGLSEDYGVLAHDFGVEIAVRNMTLVYGGGRVGLMGKLADGALSQGGCVVGIIPRALQAREVGHSDIAELIVVENMHDRKRRMFELADAFVALPGGIGTLDETFEIITWKQLGYHDKPIVILDASGYWKPLLDMLYHQRREGFVSDSTLALFTVARNLADVFAQISEAPESRVTPAPARL
jgi:uncharacterized protein (TIGR00730 family)